MHLFSMLMGMPCWGISGDTLRGLLPGIYLSPFAWPENPQMSPSEVRDCSTICRSFASLEATSWWGPNWWADSADLTSNRTNTRKSFWTALPLCLEPVFKQHTENCDSDCVPPAIRLTGSGLITIQPTLQHLDFHLMFMFIMSAIETCWKDT